MSSDQTENEDIELQEEGEILTRKNEKTVQKHDIWFWLGLLAIFVLALIPRLIFIYFISNPDNPGAGWFGDAYHHWQIAYLTREIGLDQGFLRLWDLKGMEFFWGLLHPLLTIFAFNVTGSISVGVERSLTAVMGSFSVVLVYLLVSKHWNKSAAISATILSAFNPVGIFNDASGMVEPMGIPFLLSAIYIWRRNPFWAGLLFAIAIMSRSEYWIFAIGLIFAIFYIYKKYKFDKKILLVVGFAIPLILYMKYLLDWTGNPIYPLYQNYLTNIFGTWQFKTEFTAADIAAKHLFQFIFAVSALSAGLIFWKKPKGSLVHLLGIGNWLFLGATFGLGAYIGSYADYVWYVRFMILPYIYIGILVSIFLFYYLPKIKFFNVLNSLKLNWLILLVILAVVQPVWSLIMNKYNSTEPNWQRSIVVAEEIAKHYHGGKMVFVEGNPEFTYALVKEYGFDGKNIVSQMFDPYFYFEEDPYDDWEEYRPIVFGWLKEFEVTTIVTYSSDEKYQKLAEFEPDYVSPGVVLNNANLTVFQINYEKIQKDF